MVKFPAIDNASARVMVLVFALMINEPGKTIELLVIVSVFVIVTEVVAAVPVTVWVLPKVQAPVQVHADV